MKKFLLVFIVLFSFCVSVDAQVKKYISDNVCKFYRYDDCWIESECESCLVFVVINADKDLITICSDEAQEFEIIEMEETTDDESNEVFQFKCEDEDGYFCQLLIRPNNDGTLQLVVEYGEEKYVYNIYDIYEHFEISY